MANCVHFNLDGTYAIWEMNVFQLEGQQADNCGDEVVITKSEYYDLVNGLDAIGIPDFATYGITPESVTEVAAWGFGAVIAGWALGLVTGWVAEAIRRA